MNWKIVIETDRKNCPFNSGGGFAWAELKHICLSDKTKTLKCTKKNCPYRKGE